MTFENTLTPFVADFTPGGTLYKDAGRTQVDTNGWPGGTDIGVAGVGATQGAFPDVAICVNLPNGATRKLVYVGANHIVPGTLKVRPSTIFPITAGGFTQADIDKAVADAKAATKAAVVAAVEVI